MQINRIILLSVIISALLFGTYSLGHDSGNASTNSCYNQGGDGNYCIAEIEKCEIAGKDESYADSSCFDEG